MAQFAESSKQPPAVVVPYWILRDNSRRWPLKLSPILENICASQQFILGRIVMNFEKAADFYCN